MLPSGFPRHGLSRRGGHSHRDRGGHDRCHLSARSPGATSLVVTAAASPPPTLNLSPTFSQCPDPVTGPGCTNLKNHMGLRTAEVCVLGTDKMYCVSCWPAAVADSNKTGFSETQHCILRCHKHLYNKMPRCRERHFDNFKN